MWFYKSIWDINLLKFQYPTCMASLVALTVVCFFHKTGLPGVLFVLPDSYVDAENKDYGGKFIA